MLYDELNRHYQDHIVDATKQAFPVEGKKRVLVAKKVWVDDNKDKADFEGQKKARMLEQTWGVPIKAEVELKDKATGKVIKRGTVTLAKVPKPTNLHGFIVKGKEYHLTNQFLLKPGVYNKVKADGSLASEYHLQGKAFDVRFDPKTRKFYIKAGGSKPDLYPVLKALGVSDAQLEKEWGKEILEANKKYRKSSLQSFAKSWIGKKPGSDAEAAKMIQERMKGSRLSPEVTKLTLGEEHQQVTPQVMLKSTQELLKLSRGQRKPDNSESLVFKRLRTAGTIVGDAIKEHHRVVKRKVLNNIDRTTDLDKIIPRSAFEAPVISVISNSNLSTYGDQINPLESLTNANKTTVMGEGGLKSTHAISAEMKLVDPSHLGFLDPIHTPEDSKAGVTLTLSEATKLGEDQPKAVFWDIKKKKFVRLTPKDLVGKKIVYPDQVRYDSKKGAVLPVHKKVDYHDPLEGPGAQKIDWSKADLSLVDPVQVYSQTTNLVPMLRNVAAVRASMATRQVTQAVPLKHREAPLVQVKSTVANTTNEKLYGKTLAIGAPTDGVVTKVADDHIMIRPNGSKRSLKVPLAHNLPMNGDKSMMDSEPLVKPGDKVRRGQIIADTNFTRNGELALGKNMTVAYMPFKGLNFEDGVVVSESAAKKLTSVHLHKKSLDIGKEGKLNKKGFQAHYGNLLPKENADKLDDEGVIKPGMTVQPGEILIAGLKKAQPTTEQEMLKRLSRSLVKPYSNAAVVWDKDYPGVVTDVVKKNGKVKVLVKTEQPLIKADKIVGRFANKGIVTAVVPDNEMPKTKDGKTVDVIMNPMGVPGRINLGQVFETAASKIAEKTGKPYIVSSFDPDIKSTIDKIQQDLKKHGISDTEPLYDPKTGKKLGDVQVGKQYIYKLKHMVETKATARAGGAGYAYDQDRIPKGGGKSGAKSVGNLGVYGLLSHGLYKNLQEMHTWKMDMTQADELWRAIQQGLPPPAPRPTFAYNKFVALLNAAGVDVNKDGNTLVLSPLTDKQVLKMSAGEIKDPGKMVLAKDPTKPEKGGLFDPHVTGGLGGKNWSHLQLAEPMPNPVFEKPIKAVLGITGSQFDALVAGKAGVDANGRFVSDPKQAKYVGPEAIHQALKKVNVDTELKALEKQLPTLRKDQLDKAHKKLKYLRTLKKLNISAADAYTMKYMPVLPPQFRPLGVDQDGSIVRDGINELYKGVGLINKQLKDLKGKLPDKELQALRKDNYDALKAYTGLGTHPELQYKGILGIISGKGPEGKKMVGQPKTGFFQKKLIGARQDMSMYSTITPNPQLSLDEVGLPEPLAMKLYTPFVVRKITQLQQVSPLQAREMIKKNHETARAALRAVANERPVLLKRDPVLHRYGIMGFKPKIVGGKTIQIHPLVTGGFNADFDGDQQIGSVFALLTPTFFNADLDDYSWCGNLETWIKERRLDMSARFQEVVGYVEGGVWVVCDLADFPRLEKVGEKGHIEFWSVPPGVKVVAWDEEDNRPVLADVSVWSRHKQRRVEIVTLASGRQIITDDDPRGVYGLEPETLTWTRRRPSQAKGVMVPVLDTLPEIEVTKTELALPQDSSGRLKERVVLDFDAGYFFGALVGDGWVSHSHEQSKGIHFAVTDPAVEEQWRQSLTCFFNEVPSISEARSNQGLLKGSRGSRRVQFTSAAFARWISDGDLVGTGAQDKHLPPFYLQAPEEFRLGLLAGLWDTDGTAGWSKSKNKEQFHISYFSTSIRLVRELMLLLRSFGISSTITATETPKGKPAWMLRLSTPEFYDRPVIVPFGETKQRAILDFLAQDPPDKMMAYSRYRLVPITSPLAEELQKLVSYKNHRSMYVVLSKAKNQHYMSKEMAKQVIEIVGDLCQNPLYNKWVELVESPVYFDRVKKVEVTGVAEDGYDLTVPGFETFMAVEGHVLSNTMSAYVPISQEAVQEAYKAFPSRNLFSVSSGNLMNVPKMEMTTGLFLASQPGKIVRKSYSSVKDADAAVSRGEISYNDRVMIGGKRMTVAEAKLAEALPSKLRKKYVGKLLDKKTQKQLFSDLAKENPTGYSDALNKITSLANDYMYQRGFSLSLKDYEPDRKIRDKYFKAADIAASRVKDPKKKLEIYDIAMGKAYKDLIRSKAKNPDNLFLLTLSGTKPGPDQYRQIALAPGLVTNPDGSINPRPIKSSYSEGLSMADYWTATSGARKGIITKVQSVTEPGALTKQMMNAVLDQVVVDSDCDSDFGIAEDTTSKAVLNRVLAKPVKIGKKSIPAGTVITPEIASRLRANRVKKVVVHSPLRCVHGNTGICAKCYGLDVTGKELEPGTNIGVIAAHALGERTTQLALKGFHGGGVLAIGGTQGNKQLTDQMSRLTQLLTVPKVVPNAAPLARKDGVVEDVRPDPAGGWRIKVGGEDHYVPQALGKPALVNKGKVQSIQVGMKVQKGDQLAPGIINPHELLELKGIEPVQRYLTDELYKIYEPHGIDKRHVEVVVGAITNSGRVEDPGDVPGFIRGDPVKLSTAAYLNKKVGGKRMKVQPQLKGVVVAPFELSQDWMALLNHQRLQDTISESAAQGWISDLSSTNPIPQLVLGKNIGDQFKKR